MCMKIPLNCDGWLMVVLTGGPDVIDPLVDGLSLRIGAVAELKAGCRIPERRQDR